MIVFTPGRLGRRFNLDDGFRTVAEAERAARLAELEKRRAAGAPVSEEPGAPLATEVPDPPPYEPDANAAGLSVCVRHLSERALKEWLYRLAEHKAIAEDVEERAQQYGLQVEVRRAFVRDVFGPIKGFTDETGAPVDVGSETPAGWTEEHLDLLEANGLLWGLTGIGVAYNQVFGEARGNFGASRPSISASTTAAPAHSQTGLSSGATPPGQSATSPGHDSRGTGAPELSSERSRASATPSSSSSTPGGMVA